MSVLLISTFWTALWWFIAWGRITILSEYSFFPLWLGYIFTINAVSEVLYRDSLLGRMRGWFASLFIASIPLWWFFEWVNSYLQNWHYVLLHPISQLHYVTQASRRLCAPTAVENRLRRNQPSPRPMRTESTLIANRSQAWRSKNSGDSKTPPETGPQNRPGVAGMNGTSKGMLQY